MEQVNPVSVNWFELVAIAPMEISVSPLRPCLSLILLMSQKKQLFLMTLSMSFAPGRDGGTQ